MGPGGPAAGGRPQWEGTFGESTYGRRWASPKLCLSQCFRKLHFASLQRPLVSLKAQWPDLKGFAPMPPAPCYLEERWRRGEVVECGSMAWLGA